MLEERITVIDKELQSQNHNEQIVNERKSLKEQLMHYSLTLQLVLKLGQRSNLFNREKNPHLTFR